MLPVKMHLSSALAGATFALFASTALTEAATLSFTLDDQQGSASSIADVVLTDISGGVNFSFVVNDPTNTADAAAVYFDISGYTFSDLSFSSAPGVITGTDGPTSNIQAGNIGQTFDVGVAIGNTGSGSGFFDSFDFDVLATDLDISAFFDQTFALRGQTVGPAPNGGQDSSKQFGVAGSGPDTPPAPVPLPAAGWLLLAGLGGLAAARRKRAA